MRAPANPQTPKPPNLAMHQPIRNIGDLIDILRRRKYAIIVPFAVIFIGAATVAFLLPPKYKSSTTILIEGRQIPSEFVQSTVNTLVEETIQSINHRIMSRRRLEEIINRFNLYEDLRKRKTNEEIIEKMRGDIALKTISAEVINPKSGQAGVATIAFSLSYEGKDPGKVQKVANTLASLYLEENLKNREERARTTTDFMESELEALDETINTLEAKIADFKEEHLGALPEMTEFNFQMIRRLEGQINDIEQEIRSLEERKVYLRGQLAGIEPSSPNAGLSDPKNRLEALYTQFATVKATMSPDHPDVIKLKKEIASLEDEVNIDDVIAMKKAQLETLKSELAAKQGSLSAKHPDIKKLTGAIAVVEEEIEEKVQERAKKEKLDLLKPDNPAYINISTQIETTQLEIKSLKEEAETLKTKLDEYEKKLALTPQIELEYRILTRDYENARQRYQETLNKLMVAKSAEGLEKEQKGQRFTIIDPAALPEKPFKPNRLAIVVVGFVLGMGGGIGLAMLREVSDHAIRSEMVLAYLTEKPVLAVVPQIVTKQDRKRKRIKAGLWGVSLLTAVGLGVFAVHTLYSPLDVLWFRVLRKLVSYGVISP